MIINLRGTNGAGKTTITNRVLQHYDVTEICYRILNHPIRRTMMGQIGIHKSQTIFVPGHGGGGVDTIPTLYLAYDLIFIHFDLVTHILYEGKNLTDNLDLIMGMHEAGIDIRVIFIDHPLDACIQDVRQRGHKIQEKTIIHIDDKCQREYETLRVTTVPCYNLTRREAYLTIVKWLLGEVSDVRSESTERVPSTQRHNPALERQR
jgi:hypothetical protein